MKVYFYKEKTLKTFMIIHNDGTSTEICFFDTKGEEMMVTKWDFEIQNMSEVKETLIFKN